MRRCATVLLMAVGAALHVPRVCAQARDLVDRLRAPETRQTAATALVDHGAEAAEPLMAKLQELEGAKAQGDLELARAVLDVLGRLGPVLGESAGEVSTFLLGYLEKCDRSLVLAVLRARADLSPYSGDKDFHIGFARSFSEPSATPCFVQRLRHSIRSKARTELEAGALIEELEKNRIFVREVAAEQIARLGAEAEAALPLLRAMLLDRETRPEGWDGMRHNGVVVPMSDGFALRAAEAIVRIAPHDPVSAVAYGVRAAQHPDPAIRRQALAVLGGLGPLASDALPELVQALRDPDPALAAEAVKVVGMLGPPAAKVLPAIDELRQNADPAVAGRAEALWKQVSAMATEAAAAYAERRAVQEKAAQAAADRRRRIEELIGQLGEPEKAARAVDALAAMGRHSMELLLEEIAAGGIRADRAAAVLERMDQKEILAKIPKLVEWLGLHRKSAPVALLELLGRIGRALDDETRFHLAQQILHESGDNWIGPEMTTIRGGGGDFAPKHMRIHADLTIGEPGTWDELLTFLTDENPYVRLMALQRVQEWREDQRVFANGIVLVDALGRALHSEHPGKFRVPVHARFHLHEVEARLDDEIHAAARTALQELTRHPDQEVADKAWSELKGR